MTLKFWMSSTANEKAVEKFDEAMLAMMKNLSSKQFKLLHRPEKHLQHSSRESLMSDLHALQELWISWKKEVLSVHKMARSRGIFICNT
jgi:hypothetical protein